MAHVPVDEDDLNQQALEYVAKHSEALRRNDVEGLVACDRAYRNLVGGFGYNRAEEAINRMDAVMRIIK